MITAKQALDLPTVQITDRDEMMIFQRLRASIVETIRSKFSGVPFDIQLPINLASTKVLYAIKRSFEAAAGPEDSVGWSVEISGLLNEGVLVGHKVVFSPVTIPTVRSVEGPRERTGLLDGLYEELTSLRNRSIDVGAALSDTPMLSVIFGTYNRKLHLQRVVESIRKSVGTSFPFEIVVCDGGSSDGSREWLAMQKDVVLVGDRHLTGASVAFNHCFRLVRGEYIANLNDDCLVEGGALVEGVAYLQAHADVGQVAFAFRNDDEDWHINDIYPRDRYPNVTWPTTYANFGITRKSVADVVAAIAGGFWNPIYRTYAADCELSAWIQKLGWRVAKLPRQRILDTRVDDPLRVKNVTNSGLEAKRMYARWPAEAFKPDGPDPNVSREELERFHAAKKGTLIRPASSTPDLLTSVVEMLKWPEPGEERRLRKVAPLIRALDPVDGAFPKRVDVLPRERVLHVHINGVAAEDQQRGLVRALKKLGSDGYVMVRWSDLDHDERQRAIIDEAARLKPTLLFMQLQERESDGRTVIDVETIREVRRVSDSRLVVVTWCGDIASHNSPWGVDGNGNLDWQVGLGRVCDLTLHSSLSHVRALRAAGVHNAGYLQIGYDQEQYHVPGVDEIGCGPNEAFKEYAICFLGSRYDGNDAFSRSMKWHEGGLRNEVVEAMMKAFGDRFAVYGRGFENTRGVVSVNDSHKIYWRSKIGLNVSLVNDFECYTSDRLHRILGCGSLLLTKRFVGMSTYGLRHEVNCLAWDTSGDAVRLAEDVLQHPDDLARIAEAGARLARENLTWDMRMHELSPYLDAVRSAR